MSELLFLLPPSITVVTHEVLVFLQLGIVVCRQHLTVGIDIDTRALGLLQEVSNIVEVVTTDENTRTLTYTNVHLCDLRLTVSSCVCLVEQCHHVNTVFTSGEKQLQQTVGSSVGVGDTSQSLSHEAGDSLIALSQTCCMLVVSSHAFESEYDSLLERADVFVGSAQHRLAVALSLVVALLAAPLYFMIVGQCHSELGSLGQQLFLQSDTLVDFLQQCAVVKVGIGDGGKERVHDEVIHSGVVALSLLQQCVIDGTYTTCHTQQQVHPTVCLGFLTTYATHSTSCTLGGLLTLIAKHHIFLLFISYIYCLMIGYEFCPSKCEASISMALGKMMSFST